MNHDPEEPLASRGGLKLAAALERFGLLTKVRGLRALDVGASHGGFTDTLLRAGAAHVTAVDVGHDQMRERLRADPRVEVHERTNFKTASLKLFPGPFGFFVMDVSFASSRSMMRSLSLRLTAGAEGVVLVKPQFELPAELVPPGGVVESKNLKKLAFNRFKKKAWENGFRIVERMDSPVAGAAGNVEILAHLVFDGRPEADALRPGPAPVPNLTGTPPPPPKPRPTRHHGPRRPSAAPRPTAPREQTPPKPRPPAKPHPALRPKRQEKRRDPDGD